MKMLDKQTAFDLTKLLTFIVITTIATGLLVLTIGNISFAGKKEFKAEFVDATGVVKGDDIRIAGVKVGSVSDVEIIDRSEGFARVFAFARNFDPEIARTTLGIFRPAVQLTFDGLYFFLAGVILGLIVSNLISAPFRYIGSRRRYFGRMP